MNALRHGSCAETLILECENMDDWLDLLDRWLNEYQPGDDTLAYDFVLKAAQAEWERIRCCRNYDLYRVKLGGFSPLNWTAEQIKTHDLHQRYRNAAQRSFQREYRLQEHYKTREAKPKKLQPTPSTDTIGEVKRIIVPDPNSPTGFTVDCEIPPIPGLPPCPRPYYPPTKESGGS